MRNFLMVGLLATALFAAPVAMAEPTAIEVSALAHGAKFLGDRSGGARITIADAETGKVLAEGVTQGGTGDTGLIMKKAQPHWAGIATGSSASFTATLDIEAPRRLAITATGPLEADFEDQVRASTTTWLLPGAPLVDDRRLVVELMGYWVTVTDSTVGDGVAVEIDVGMLCGCPVMPGGLWDADRIDMRAILHGSRGSEKVSLTHVEGTRYLARFDGKVGNPEVVEFRLRGKDDANVTVKRHLLD